MPPMKKRGQGRVPKVSRQHIAPDRASHMMKQAYLKKHTQDCEEREYKAGYATNQVERITKWAVDEAATDVSVVIKRKSVPAKTEKQEPAEPSSVAQPAPPQAGCATEGISEEPVLSGRTSALYEGETGQICRSQPNRPKTRRTEAATSKMVPVSRLPEQQQEVCTPPQKPAAPRAIKERPAADKLKRRENSGTMERPAADSPPRQQISSTFPRGMFPQSKPISQRARTAKRDHHPIANELLFSEEPRNASGTEDRQRGIQSTLSQTRRRDTEEGHRGIKTRQYGRTGHVRTKGAIKAHSDGAKPKLSPAIKAKQTAQKSMKHQMAVNTKKTVKSVAVRTKQLVIVATKLVAQTVSLATGFASGCVLLVALICVVVIAAVASSPFGLFFAEEKNAPDTVSVAEAVGAVNMVYNTNLEAMQRGDYDSIVVHGQAADWPEVLAVFAVKLAGADVDGMDVVTMDAQRVEKLTAVFWDMTTLTKEVEMVEHGTEESRWTETILHITITPKPADTMRTAYAFTSYQNSALDELLGDRAALAALAGSLQITNAEVQKVLMDLPGSISQVRRDVVETALSLVGKVNYFWGGKSHAIGWDSRWGTLQKVTAAGSPSTGTYRPYGLDCSGMIDWTLRNVGIPSDGNWYVGVNLTEISDDEALPGDMALFADASHIGLIVGRSEAGKLLVCHCSSGQNNVVITEAATSDFTVIGRPDIFN